jgi:AraC-like DNA-binding protein
LQITAKMIASPTEASIETMHHSDSASTGAVPAQATGFFHEQPAPKGLNSFFSAIWVHRMTAVGTPPVIISPDATIDLQWIDGTFRVAGPDKVAQTEILPAGGLIVGFRFQPGAAARWLGVPASEILGQRIALADLWGRRAQPFSTGTLPAGGLPQLLSSLMQIVGRHSADQETDPAMRVAYDLIGGELSSGELVVPRLMRTLHMSERTLRRRVEESFGYGPKTLERILRYQRFQKLSRETGGSMAMLALEAGYADQAHLIRESRRLTGLTPFQWQRFRLISDRQLRHCEKG